MKINSESDFKKIPKLRWRQDVDGTPVAICRKLRLKRDRLCFYAPGKLQLLYFREWPGGAGSGAHRMWRRRILAAGGRILEEHPLDGEGFFIIQADSGQVPREFLKGAAGSRAGFVSRPASEHERGPKRGPDEKCDLTYAGVQK